MGNPLDTVTIVLSGEVPLADFAQAITHFDSLLKGLSSETGDQGVEWIIQDLEISSTIATARGIGERERVERVVRAYAEVGTALEQNIHIPYSKKVQQAAHGLKGILNGKIDSVRFETAEREVIIRSPREGQRAIEGSAPQLIISPSAPPSAFGAVGGRVQTLTNRGGLRFTLYDILHDKAVSCYLKEGFEELMRDSWGKLARVMGLVTRDPLSGRPLSIRQVSQVVIEKEELGDYRDARGVSPALTDLSPEDAIRRLRDA